MSAHRAPLTDTSRRFVNAPRPRASQHEQAKPRRETANNNNENANENANENNNESDSDNDSDSDSDANFASSDFFCKGDVMEPGCTAPTHPHNRLAMGFVKSNDYAFLPFAPSVKYYKALPPHVAAIVQAPPPKFMQSQYRASHHSQKLSSGDKFPQLMGTSTPKKDGYLPSLLKPGIMLPPPKQTQESKSATTNNKSTMANANSNSNRKMTGEELERWKLNWREILKRSYIYIDEYDSSNKEQRKAVVTFRKLGAIIEKHASSKTTIIISEKSSQDFLSRNSNANLRNLFEKTHLKIWNYSKVARFLTHLSEPLAATDELTPSISSAKSNHQNNVKNNVVVNDTNNNLNDLLMNERLLGPSDRDPTVKRNDFKYFTGFYIYLYDITQKTRPIAVREWKDKWQIPHIGHTTNGKSIFLHENDSSNPLVFLKRHLRRMQFLHDTFVFREEIIQETYFAGVSFNNAMFQGFPMPYFKTRVKFKKMVEDYLYGNGNSNNNTGKQTKRVKPIEKWKRAYMQLTEDERKPFKKLFDSAYHEIYGTQSYYKRELHEQYAHLTRECSSDLEYPYTHDDYIYDDDFVKQRPLKLGIKFPPPAAARDLEDGKVKEIDEQSSDVFSPPVDYGDDFNQVEVEDGDHDDGDHVDGNHYIDGYGYDYDYDDDDDNDDDGEADDESNLQNLISDKSDVIDQMNHPFSNPTLNTQLQSTKKENADIQEPISINRPAMPLLPTRPSLIRNDTRLEAASHQTNDGKSLLREYDELAASGIQASGVNPSGNALSHGNAANFGNGLGPSRSQVINKRLVNEHRRIVVLTPNLPAKGTKRKYPSGNAEEGEGEIPLDIEKASTSKNSINEDELAALRSVEAANPFISDGHGHVGNRNIQPKKLKIKCKKITPPALNKRQETAEPVGKGVVIKKEITREKNDKKEDKEKVEEKPKRDAKPGYCENCRVKYSDFHAHIHSDKHRSFALNEDNFVFIDEMVQYFSIQEQSKNQANTCIPPT